MRILLTKLAAILVFFVLSGYAIHGNPFRDCDVCPEMVVVPAGEFTMGSPEDEQGRDSDEGPQHRVWIAKPFAVGRFEVTFEEWDACVADGGCGDYRPGDEEWGRGRRPVINVSWDDAKAYARWLSRKTGKTYRLLSEAEWEYAARAGTATRFSYGDDPNYAQLCDYGNHADKSTDYSWRNENCSDGVGKKTAEVGGYKPNGFGLHDMHGNVWEWTDDCWYGNYNGAPTDGSARLTGDCTRRVLRGGSWFDTPRRPAFRYSPQWHSSGVRGNYIGFRVARTL